MYPRRWEKAGYAPVCANEWQRGVCHKPRVRCGACPNQAFVPITDDAVEGHLRGHHTLGVYPMLADDTCRFLAADFDKETWRRDAGAYLSACHAKKVPAALARSRSGNGAHVWFFFEEPVAASLARRLGAHILTEAMECDPDIGSFCLSSELRALRPGFRESRGVAHRPAGAHRGEPHHGVNRRLARHCDEGGVGRLRKVLDGSEAPLPANRLAARHHR